MDKGADEADEADEAEDEMKERTPERSCMMRSENSTCNHAASCGERGSLKDAEEEAEADADFEADADDLNAGLVAGSAPLSAPPAPPAPPAEPASPSNDGHMCAARPRNAAIASSSCGRALSHAAAVAATADDEAALVPTGRTEASATTEDARCA